jgi:formamidopyrimidine-DNA glycosylase
MTPMAAALDGAVEKLDVVDVVTSLECKGKFIYLTLDRGRNETANTTTDDYKRSIWITLGMTGQFVNEDIVNTTSTNNDASSPRWYMELMDLTSRRSRRIYYRDARNFGTLKFVLSARDLQDKLESLGADLLDEDTTEDVFLRVMEQSVQNRNICKFLMDQGKIAGVG